MRSIHKWLQAALDSSADESLGKETWSLDSEPRARGRQDVAVAMSQVLKLPCDGKLRCKLRNVTIRDVVKQDDVGHALQRWEPCSIPK